MVYFMKTPMEMDDLGVALFGETSAWQVQMIVKITLGMWSQLKPHRKVHRLDGRMTSVTSVEFDRYPGKLRISTWLLIQLGSHKGLPWRMHAHALSVILKNPARPRISHVPGEKRHGYHNIGGVNGSYTGEFRFTGECANSMITRYQTPLHVGLVIG